MKYQSQALGAIAIFGLLLPATAATADKTVAEEILDVLRAQGSISEAQYETWTQRAQEERAAWNRPEESEDAASGDGESSGAERPFVTWKDGIRFHPADDIEIRLGGRVYADYAHFNADDDTVEFFDDDTLDGGSGAEFSRARIFVAGTLYDVTEFKAEFDFGNTGDEGVEAKDIYLRLLDVPWIGSVQAGHFKEPYTLQRLISSRHIQFMERSVMNTFSTNRNTGISMSNGRFEDRMTWSIGGFIEVNDSGFTVDKNPNHHLSTRLTGLPFVREGDRKLLHLGLSYIHRFVGKTIRYSSKPESNLSSVVFVDTGDFPANHANQITPELALTWGPFSFQTEYTAAFLDAPRARDPTFHGLYVQAGWFLTGEHRPYNRKRAIFDKVRPHRNFDLKGGPGAWQLGVRYSRVDLADGIFSRPAPGQGRRLNDFTAGLNWHLNPYMRIMFNYVRADLDDVGVTHIVQNRVQFDY